MTLNDCMKREAAKLRLITFTNDCNTVVVHHVNAWPVEGNVYIMAEESGCDWYRANMIVNFPDCGYAIDARRTDLLGVDDSIEVLRGHVIYTGETAQYFDIMKQKMEYTGYIFNTEMLLAEKLVESGKAGGFEDMPEKMQAWKIEYLRKREEEDSARREAEEAARREEERREAEARERKIDALETALKAGGERIKADYTLLPELAKRHNVNIPIKVQGWIKAKLRTVTIKDGTMTGYSWERTGKRDNGSESVFKYVDMLLAALA